MQKKTGKDALLWWCQEVTKGYKDVSVSNFHTSWGDGLAFCAIIHRYHPERIPFDSLKKEQPAKNLGLAFRVGEDIGIPALLDVEDMLIPKPEQFSVMTYLSQFYHRFVSEGGGAGLATVTFSSEGSARMPKAYEAKAQAAKAERERMQTQQSSGSLIARPATTASSNTTSSSSTPAASSTSASSRASTDGPVCNACSERITGDVLKWTNADYHPNRCLRCSRCATVLGGPFVKKLGTDPLCNSCFDATMFGGSKSPKPAAPNTAPGLARSASTAAMPAAGAKPSAPIPANAKLCAKCALPLRGSVIESCGAEWHEACFGCTTCNKKLQVCINVGGKPYCDQCGRKAFANSRASAYPAAATDDDSKKKEQQAAEERKRREEEEYRRRAAQQHAEEERRKQREREEEEERRRQREREEEERRRESERKRIHEEEQRKHGEAMERQRAATAAKREEEERQRIREEEERQVRMEEERRRAASLVKKQEEERGRAASFAKKEEERKEEERRRAMSLAKKQEEERTRASSFAKREEDRKKQQEEKKQRQEEEERRRREHEDDERRREIERKRRETEERAKREEEEARRAQMAGMSRVEIERMEADAVEKAMLAKNAKPVTPVAEPQPAWAARVKQMQSRRQLQGDDNSAPNAASEERVRALREQTERREEEERRVRSRREKEEAETMRQRKLEEEERSQRDQSERKQHEEQEWKRKKEEEWRRMADAKRQEEERKREEERKKQMERDEVERKRAESLRRLETNEKVRKEMELQEQREREERMRRWADDEKRATEAKLHEERDQRRRWMEQEENEEERRRTQSQMKAATQATAVSSLPLQPSAPGRAAPVATTSPGRVPPSTTSPGRAPAGTISPGRKPLPPIPVGQISSGTVARPEELRMSNQGGSTIARPPVLEGYLEKQDPGGFKVWRKRWFSVLKAEQVMYWETAETANPSNPPLGVIALELVSVLHVDDTPGKFQWEMDTPERTYYLRAPDTETRDRWVTALRHMLATIRARRRPTGVNPVDALRPREGWLLLQGGLLSLYSWGRVYVTLRNGFLLWTKAPGGSKPHLRKASN